MKRKADCTGTSGKGRTPADGGDQNLLERMRALSESIRRQMAARRQNRARSGGSEIGPNGR